MSTHALLSYSRVTALRLFFLLLMVCGVWLPSPAEAQNVTVWGRNEYFQNLVPAGLTNVTAASAGEQHILALKSNGTVVAWGNNFSHQSAVLPGLNNVVAVAAGPAHSLALTSDGTVVWWGDPPPPPAELTGVVAIAAGTHSMALKQDGTVQTWPWGLGTPIVVPLEVKGATAIAAGHDSFMALKSDGRVVVWGRDYLNGGTPPPGLTSIVAIAAGWHHFLALKSNGTVLAWGQNTYGQTTVPTGLTGVVAIAAGFYHSMALKSDGTLVTWGSNVYNERTIPGGLDGVMVAIAAGGHNSIALTTPPGAAAPMIVGPSLVRTDAAGSMGGSLQFYYRIVATGSPASFAATGLPPGLSLDTATGIITGVATQTGNFPVTLSATNATGAGNRQLTIVVAGAPSFPALPGRLWSAGIPVTPYQVPADHLGTLWTATGLPPGLSIDPATGVITGVPTEPGIYSVNLSVTNAYGSGMGVQWMEISPLVAWGRNDTGQSTVPAALVSVVSMSSSDTFSAAVRRDGSIFAWGHNSSGQSPGTVPGNAVKVAAGNAHGLALTPDGTVVAWGDNSSGQTNVPAGLNGVVAISAVGRASLALKSNGAIVSWGSISPRRQVIGAVAIAGTTLALKSDGTVEPLGTGSVPADLGGVIDIAAGPGFSLALKRDGTVVAWGGDGVYVNYVPAGLSGVVAISACSNHWLALKSDGTVVAWGSNTFGESTVPAGLTGVVAINAGSGFSGGGVSMALGGSGNGTPPVVVSPAFAVTDAAGTMGSGLQFHYRIAATGSPVSYAATGLPPGLSLDVNSGIISGVATATGTFAVTVSATNAAGTGSRPVSLIVRGVPEFLGLPPAILPAGVRQTLLPYAVGGGSGGYSASGLPPGLSIDAATGVISGTPTHPGIYHVTLGLNNAFGNTQSPWDVEISPVFAWGAETDSLTTLPPGLSTATAIAAGGRHALALRADGTVVAWGNNSSGQTAVTGLSDVKAIAAGQQHSLALLTDGSVIAWGSNTYGQSAVPPTLSNVTAISAGAFFSMALQSDGTVVAWGANDYGQRVVPPGLSGVTAIAAGGYHALALRNNGTVVTWGNNSYLQMDVPPGLSGVAAIAAGAFQSLALKSDGTVVGWGAYAGPGGVPGGLTGVAAIASGFGVVSPGFSNHIALKSDGTVVTWGLPNIAPVALSGVTAVDAGGDIADRDEGYFLSIVVAPPMLLNAPSLTAHVGTVFFHQLMASGPPTSYAATGLPPGLSLNSANGRITGTPTQPGVFAVSLTMRGQSTGTAQIFISVLPDAAAAQSAYAAWRDTKWPGGGPSTSPGDDADGDGRLNVMEFALGSDPNQPNHGTVPIFTRDAAGRLELQVDILASAAGALLIKAQFSSDLLFGAGTVEASGIAQSDPPAGMVRLKFVDPDTTAGNVRRYGRLHVTLPTPP